MATKTIFLLGATGPTGIIFIQKAVAQGHKVVAFVRSPSKIPEKYRSHDNVKVVEGNLWEEQSLSSAMKGCDIVISILGPSTLRTKPDTFVGPYRTIFKLMRRHFISRILAMGTYSIPDSKDKSSWLMSLLVYIMWMVGHPTWQEIVNVGKVFDEDANDLAWTIYRLGLVKDGVAGDVATTYIGEKNFTASITRNELAGWLLDQVEKSQVEYLREKPAICSVGKAKSG